MADLTAPPKRANAVVRGVREDTERHRLVLLQLSGPRRRSPSLSRALMTRRVSVHPQGALRGTACHGGTLRTQGKFRSRREVRGSPGDGPQGHDGPVSSHGNSRGLSSLSQVELYKPHLGSGTASFIVHLGCSLCASLGFRGSSTPRSLLGPPPGILVPTGELSPTAGAPAPPNLNF